MTSEVNPVLLFGYGNLSRGDDALGPLLLEFVESHLNLGNIDLLSDFQLQIEHALDLEGRALVLFVDASVSCAGPFDFTEIGPGRDKSYSTHAMSPSAVLAVYQTVKKQTPPPCFLLSIKAEQFELGSGLSAKAESRLTQACQFAAQLLHNPTLDFWRQAAQCRVNLQEYEEDATEG
jgi:hydrogenase maturation protease